MEFNLFTTVWGAWHTECLRRGMLPSLLAQNNLPALAARHKVHYRILTTEQTLSEIQRLPYLEMLRQLVDLQISTVAREDNVNAELHVSFWQQAVEESREKGAVAVSVHPDVIWSDGTFRMFADQFEQGRVAVYVHNLRVVADTLLPELERLTNKTSGTLALSGRDAAGLALVHLHPLSAVSIPSTPYAGAGHEYFWPVQGSGLILRQAAGWAIAANPARCTLDFEFFVRDQTSLKNIHTIENTDEMIMLSLAPLGKDFGIFELNQPFRPFGLGRWIAHPFNFSLANAELLERSLRLPLPGAQNDEKSWREALAASNGFGHAAINAMMGIRLFHALIKAGCQTAAQIIAAALHETDIAEKLVCPKSGVVVLAPRDDADGLKAALKLLATDRESDLVALLLGHLLVGPVDFDNATHAETLGGAKVTIERDQTGTRINRRRILSTDVVDTVPVWYIDGVMAL